MSLAWTQSWKPRREKCNIRQLNPEKSNIPNVHVSPWILLLSVIKGNQFHSSTDCIHSEESIAIVKLKIQEDRLDCFWSRLDQVDLEKLSAGEEGRKSMFDDSEIS
ncbi:uncharacterized protein [Bemisia tabaci]|uniref:uncharacterized protein n=1 Tax=Bemisia tabaci TaxID=7038 RepID=UPI003B27DEE9